MISNSVQRLTCPRQRPFGLSHHGLISGQLCLGDRRRADHAAEGFLSSFDHRHWLVGHPVPAEGFRPPHGRPTRWVPKHPPGPRRGFHVPHTRVTAGLGALFTPRPRGAQPTSPIPLAVACPLFQGPGPIAPVHRSCLLRGVVKGSLAFTRPAFPPARSSLDGTGTALGALPGLRTPQTRGPATHAEAGDGHRALARSYRTTDIAAPPSQ